MLVLLKLKLLGMKFSRPGVCLKMMFSNGIFNKNVTVKLGEKNLPFLLKYSKSPLNVLEKAFTLKTEFDSLWESRL